MKWASPTFLVGSVFVLVQKFCEIIQLPTKPIKRITQQLQISSFEYLFSMNHSFCGQLEFSFVFICDKLKEFYLWSMKKQSNTHWLQNIVFLYFWINMSRIEYLLPQWNFSIQNSFVKWNSSLATFTSQEYGTRMGASRANGIQFQFQY